MFVIVFSLKSKVIDYKLRRAVISEIIKEISLILFAYNNNVIDYNLKRLWKANGMNE